MSKKEIDRVFGVPAGHWAKKEQYSAEKRQCNVCGEIWVDTGEPACPFCGSGDTNPVEDEQCNPD